MVSALTFDRPLLINERRYKTVLVHFGLLLALLAEGAKSLNFTLASDDGSYYPYLDALLQNSSYSYIVGSSQEIQALPEYNSTTHSFPIIGRKAVVAESFFSVFSAAQIPLWNVENGVPYVSVYFDVRNDAELLLLGFNLDWGAQPSRGRTQNPSSSQFSNYPLINILLAKLLLYVEVSGTGRLQLLHCVITNVPCDGLQRLFDGLNVISNNTNYLASIGKNVTPSLRLVYPYLFIKYSQLGPIWVEDMTLSCASSANLSPAACPEVPPTVVNVSNHVELISALTQMEAVHVPRCQVHTTVLRLVRDVTLDVARWPRGGGGLFITSNVTFECDPGQNITLDFAGGLNLFKLRAAAFVRIHNLVVINLAMAPVGIFTVPIWAFHFERDLTVVEEGRLHMVNTTGVIARDEFKRLQFWTSILTNPVQAVAALAAWQHLIGNWTLSAMTNDTITFAQITGMGVTCAKIAITMSPVSASERLLQPLTGVDQLLSSDFFAGPPYTIAIYSAAQLYRTLSYPDSRLTRLAQADGLENASSTAVLLLLQKNITLDPAFWPAGALALPVRRRVIIQGKPYNGIELDFGGLTNFLTAVDPDGGVSFRYLTLRGLGWLTNYTAASALQKLPPPSFLQTGMWIVSFERTGVPRASLQSTRLFVSRQELDVLITCWNSYKASNASSSAIESNTSGSSRASNLLPLGLRTETCSQLIPQSSQLANVSSELGIIAARSMALPSFDASSIILAVDPNVNRPDLVLFMEGAYPSNVDTGRSSSTGTNIAAIVGGVGGGIVGCILLAMGFLLYSNRWNSARRQEEQEAALRGLQAKQANQLEELSKRNPLAQLILDHLAGKEPAAATKLVLAGGSRVSSHGAFADVIGRTGSTSIGAGGVNGGSFGGLGGDEECASGHVAAAASTTPPPPGAAEGSTAPVNINAIDLAELFKHLTILGVANHSNDGGGGDSGGILDSRGSRGSRSGTKTATGGSAESGSHGVNGAGGGALQPLSGLLTLPQVVLHRISRRSKARGVQSRERERESSARRSVTGMAGSAGSKGDTVSPQLQGSTGTSGGATAAVAAASGARASAAAVASADAASGNAGTHMVAADGARVDASAMAALTANVAAAAACGIDVEKGSADGGVCGSNDAGREGGGAANVPVNGADDKALAAGANVTKTASICQKVHEQVAQSPVLEELLRLSLDLAGEIDDNQLIVTDVVASGGFGTVYRGTWHNLSVAVKIVLFSTASVNRRIALQEAALSKSISHPNIIATYAVDAKPMAVLGRANTSASGTGGGVVGGHNRPDQTSCSLAEIQEWRLYIIQEFADGGTLRRALDSGAFHEPHLGLPRMDMILDIAQGVAAALAHLHTKNVVHGDLNPKNVLLKVVPLPGSSSSHASSRSAAVNGLLPAKLLGVAGSGVGFRNSVPSGPVAAAVHAAAAAAAASQYGHYPLAGRCGFAIKVADFGLSVKMENSHISGLRQGTPFYAAPELSRLGLFSRAADIYAFGVLLWELYWGRPIWVPDTNAPGGYVQHANFPLLPADCPPEYGGLVADCLQLNHMQRPGFDEIVGRLRLTVHGLRHILTPTITMTSGSLGLNSFDGSGVFQMAMSNLPPSLLHQLHQPLHHPTLQGEKLAQGQPQFDVQRPSALAASVGMGGAAAAAAAAAALAQQRHHGGRVKPTGLGPMLGVAQLTPQLAPQLTQHQGHFAPAQAGILSPPLGQQQQAQHKPPFVLPRNRTVGQDLRAGAGAGYIGGSGVGAVAAAAATAVSDHPGAAGMTAQRGSKDGMPLARNDRDHGMGLPNELQFGNSDSRVGREGSTVEAAAAVSEAVKPQWSSVEAPTQAANAPSFPAATGHEAAAPASPRAIAAPPLNHAEAEVQPDPPSGGRTQGGAQMAVKVLDLHLRPVEGLPHPPMSLEMDGLAASPVPDMGQVAVSSSGVAGGGGGGSTAMSSSGGASRSASLSPCRSCTHSGPAMVSVTELAFRQGSAACVSTDGAGGEAVSDTERPGSKSSASAVASAVVISNSSDEEDHWNVLPVHTLLPPAATGSAGGWGMAGTASATSATLGRGVGIIAAATAAVGLSAIVDAKSSALEAIREEPEDLDEGRRS